MPGQRKTTRKIPSDTEALLFSVDPRGKRPTTPDGRTLETRSNPRKALAVVITLASVRDNLITVPDLDVPGAVSNRDLLLLMLCRAEI